MAEDEAPVISLDAVTESPGASEEVSPVSNDENKVPNEPTPSEEKTPAPEAEQTPASPNPSEEPESVTVDVSLAEPAPEPEPEPPKESPEDIQRRLDAQTSFIDSIDSISVSLKDAEHPQLQRPGVKPNARRGRTKQTKSFADLEEEERQRQEEALKPRGEDVDQKYEDTLGLLSKGAGQRTVSMAQEAQNVHAAFMQKAKERKEREEAEKKAKEAAIQEERISKRMSSGGARPKSMKGSKPVAAVKNGDDDGKVLVEVQEGGGEAGDEGEVKVGFADRMKAKLQEQGCCTIS